MDELVPSHPAPVVLLVEDEPDLRTVIENLLLREGCQAASVGSGAEAIDWLRSHRAALLLIDYRLPDMNAGQLVDLLAQRGHVIPFVVVTGHGNEQIAVEMMKRGARDYVIKDASFYQVLGSVVRRATGKATKTGRTAATDLSDPQRAAEALRQSEERYRQLVDHAPDAIFVNQGGRIAYVNDAGVRLLGATSASQIIGRNALDLAHPDYRAIVRERIVQIFEHKQAVPLLEEKLLAVDGRTVDVEVAAMPCVYGGQDAAQIIVRDIRDRKHAEEDARQHQAQLAHVMRLNTMGNMVSQLAHEINQPLYAIANYASACKQTLGFEDVQGRPDLCRWIQQISDQAHRAGEIIRRLSQFVRKDPPRRSALSLNDLIRDIVTLVEIDARVHNVQIRLALKEQSPVIVADRIQIEQVLVNLVLNGIEAMNQVKFEDRELRVCCTTEADEVEVAVQDNGTGIQDEDMPKVFESFFTTKPAGMGMGLPISHAIIDAHQGRLWATRNSDRGMTFHFTLPLASEGDSHAN